MPSRRDIFTNGNIYHIFNKTIDHKKIFTQTTNTDRFFDLIRYYRSIKSKLRYSRFKQLPDKLKKRIEEQITFEKYFKIELLAYNLMPNHFHLLVKQIKNGGIVRSITDILNAFTRYFNVKENRLGSLFLTQFKSKVMMSREQLMHTGRYIHINHYSSGIVDSLEDIVDYPYSSLKEYLAPDPNNLCNTELMLAEFNNSREQYKKFILNHADYQKNLEIIKHTIKWS